MNPAKQAIKLLRNQMTTANLRALTEAERQQFIAIIDHWLKLADLPTTGV